MSDWICQVCGVAVRGRIRPPSFCPQCRLGFFKKAGGAPASPSRSTPPSPHDTAPRRPTTPVPPPDVRVTRLTPIPTVPVARRERRRASRVQPKDPLEVHLPGNPPLKALDISAIGLLVEHASPCKPGSMYELELLRSGRRIRLRAQVVRSVVTGGGKGSQIRYRTAFQFLETSPPALFALVLELSQTP